MSDVVKEYGEQVDLSFTWLEGPGLVEIEMNLASVDRTREKTHAPKFPPGPSNANASPCSRCSKEIVMSASLSTCLKINLDTTDHRENA